MFHQQDEEWVRKIQTYRSKISTINITSDITSIQGKQVLSRLDEIYGDIRLLYGDIMKQYEEVDSLINRIRRKAEARGNNTEVRKANGIRAVENVETGDGTVHNLYDIMTHLNFQKEDLESLLAIIDKKQSMVITMSGLLKVESNIVGH
jgi:hypothetical protein